MSAPDRIRRRIAVEAARLMVEEGLHEYLAAKQKAAVRLGIADTRALPRNEEIDQALSEYHRIYRAEVQPRHIARLRTLALEAMHFLAAFSPRLAGGVLDGSAGEFSPITLHLSTDQPEAVIQRLLEHGIRFEEKSVCLSAGQNRSETWPALSFLADGVRIELVLLPENAKQARPARKDAPKGTPAEVEALIRLAEAETR